MARTAPRILPHGPLEALGDNLWSVEGELPKMGMKRRMTAVRREDGSLLIHSAMTLSDKAMAELDGLGPVRQVLVPNRFHRMDAPAYRSRYPEAAFFCPPGALKHVSRVIAETADYAAFVPDARVKIEILDGLKQREGVLVVRDGERTSLVFCDAFFNVHGGGFMLKLLGSSGGPKVTRIAKMTLVADKKAFRTHLERLASTDGLAHLVPGHGDVVHEDPAGTLQRVANAL